MVWHGEGWAPPCGIAQSTLHADDNRSSIQTRSTRGTRTAPCVAGHQDGGEKYATNGPKSLRARNNLSIGTWNVRSMRTAGKIEELTHEMKRYQWNILGLCEVRWKNFGEASSSIYFIYFHGHSPSWGYADLNSRGEKIEDWMITGPQPPNHILQSCPTFDALRRQTLPSPVDVHRKLWGPVETLRQTADFALLTRLKIQHGRECRRGRAVLHSCDLESKSRSVRLVSKCRV